VLAVGTLTVQQSEVVELGRRVRTERQRGCERIRYLVAFALVFVDEPVERAQIVAGPRSNPFDGGPGELALTAGLDQRPIELDSRLGSEIDRLTGGQHLEFHGLGGHLVDESGRPEPERRVSRLAVPAHPEVFDQLLRRLEPVVVPVEDPSLSIDQRVGRPGRISRVAGGAPGRLVLACHPCRLGSAGTITTFSTERPSSLATDSPVMRSVGSTTSSGSETDAGSSPKLQTTT
jgi:hypothetical protein